MTYTLRIVDQTGQPARVYPMETLGTAVLEARTLVKGCLQGGYVQIYEGAPDTLRGDETPVRVVSRFGRITIEA